MPKDEIVEEVRKARERLLEENGGTLEGLFARLKALTAAEKRPVVRLPPRLPAQKKNEVA